MRFWMTGLLLFGLVGCNGKDDDSGESSGRTKHVHTRRSTTTKARTAMQGMMLRSRLPGRILDASRGTLGRVHSHCSIWLL